MRQNSSLSIFGLMHFDPVSELVTFHLNIEQRASWQFLQRNKIMWIYVRHVHNFMRISHKRDDSTSAQLTRKSKTTDARVPSWNPSKQSTREPKWFQKYRWRRRLSIREGGTLTRRHVQCRLCFWQQDDGHSTSVWGSSLAFFKLMFWRYRGMIRLMSMTASRIWSETGTSTLGSRRVRTCVCLLCALEMIKNLHLSEGITDCLMHEIWCSVALTSCPGYDAPRSARNVDYWHARNASDTLHDWGVAPSRKLTPSSDSSASRTTSWLELRRCQHWVRWVHGW